MTHTQKALAYCNDVISGDIPSCTQIKQACERTLGHFSLADREDYPFYYDEDEAERVCTIVERMPHTKGVWAQRGETLILQPWQCWIITSIYGWRYKATGLRKYRRATLLIPRKQGKSILIAALMVYHLLFDGEYGAECYCAAKNREQAGEVWDTFREMLNRSEDICKYAGVEIAKESVIAPSLFAKAKRVAGRPKDGASVSFGVLDEVHECPNLAVLESFQTGTGARSQPLVIGISTAGIGTDNPSRQIQLEAERMLSGAVEDEEMFAAIYTIDSDVEWTSELALRMANPNFGVSVQMDYLLAQQKIARNNPEKYAFFVSKHLNMTVGSTAGFFNLTRWKECRTVDELEMFKGEPCWLGMDLSNKLDLTAISLVFRREVDGDTHYYVFCEAFAPEDTVAGNNMYARWANIGALSMTPGKVVSRKALRKRIVELSDEYKIMEIAYDPWNAEDTVQLLAESLPDTALVEVMQRATHLSTPMRLMQELVAEKKIHHDGNPVLEFCIGNTIAKPFNNLIMPAKERDEAKIDAAVATMMAISRAAVHKDVQEQDISNLIFSL